MSRRPRLLPFELVAAGASLCGLAFLLLHGLPVGGRGLSRTLSLAVSLLGVGAIVGVGLQALAHAIGRRPLRDYLARLREPSWWRLWGRLWLACMAVSFVYFWVKVYVPITNPGIHDPAIWSLERALHLGVAPTTLATRWLTAPVLLRVLDVWYGIWLLTLGSGIAFFAASAHDRDRRATMLSFLLLWAIGAALYTAIPVTGPVYAFPGMWQALPRELPLAATTQGLLGAQYDAVLAGARAGSPGFDYTRGVAALPSLHVGFHALFALWLRVLWPRAFALGAALTVLTLVGSVRTGWHYAVDGYAGVGCAVLAFWLARRLERGAPASADPGAGR